MFKRVLIGTTLLMLVFALALTAGDSKWFDMENCSMCKNFTKHEGLMQNMKWEQHKITNGMFSMGFASDEKYVAAYKEANASCDALGEKLMAGEEHPLCGSCMSFGDLLAKGATMDNVEISNGGVHMLTSSDPEVVKAIHAWVDKNTDEMKKMMAGGEAHSH